MLNSQNFIKCLAYYYNIKEHYDSNTEHKYELGLILEKCDMTLLDEVNSTQKPFFTEAEFKKEIAQVTQGFLLLEQLGIYYGDISLKNLFIKDSRLKIGDFDVSLNRKCSVWNNHYLAIDTKSIRGTENYLAPELFYLSSRSRDEDDIKFNYDSIKADVFSLGLCMLQYCGQSIKNLNNIDYVYEEKIIDGQSVISLIEKNLTKVEE